MRALKLWAVCIFATSLSLGNIVSSESEDATSLVQFSQAVSQRSAENKPHNVSVETNKTDQAPANNKKTFNMPADNLKKDVPVFMINLDDPPKKRWLEVAMHYRNELIAMQEPLSQSINSRFDFVEGAQWMSHSSINHYPEQLEELKGVAEAVNHPSVTVESLVLSSLLHEMSSPIKCSAVLWADPEGTVFHGRGIDYSMQWTMPDGTQKNWPDVTHEAHFYKGGKLLYKSTQWPVAGGITTAMRVDGWSIQQNHRDGKNDAQSNLAAAKNGGVGFGFAIRHIMETTPDFETALSKIKATNFMAPQYLIMAGAKPWEGAVLPVGRMGATVQDGHGHDLETLLNTERWHVVQTNDDQGTLGLDARRKVATAMIDTLNRTWMNEDRMMQFMHSPPLFVEDTAFSNVMVPSTGYYKTALPTQSPSALQGFDLTRAAAFAEWGAAKGQAEAASLAKSVFR